ncbi:hypothetical protein ACPC54_18045 [Kitasatospora sp. NPDC094028]
MADHLAARPPAPGLARVVLLSRAQKDCAACVCCGVEGGDLVPDGHVYVPGLPDLAWAVVAHPTCLAEPS